MNHPRKLLAKSLLIVLISSAAIGLSVSKVNAYSVRGDRWINNYNITYTFLSMQSYDYTGFQQGINAWNYSAAPIIFNSGGNNGEVIMEDANEGATGWDGLSWWSYIPGAYCTRYHAGNNELARAYTLLNVYYTSQYKNTGNLGRIQGVAAHEMGHAIGLNHSSVSTALMYYTTGSNTPQIDDTNGAWYIYDYPCV